ncbi:MAG: ABC transporter substrate-binding protein [Planctomycetota bacterium]
MPSVFAAPTSGPRVVLCVALLVLLLLPCGCGGNGGNGGHGMPPNYPYPAADAGRDIYYYYYITPPKTLDPARSYSADEYDVIGPIYEAPLQYHFLRRPYSRALMPNTAVAMPRPVCQWRPRVFALTLGDAREEPGSLLRLDAGRRGGITAGASGLTTTLTLRPPDGEAVAVTFPLIVRELDEYGCMAMLDRQSALATLRANASGGANDALLRMVASAPIAVPAGTPCEAVYDWTAVDEPVLREFLAAADERTRRATKAAEWRAAAPDVEAVAWPSTASASEAPQFALCAGGATLMLPPGWRIQRMPPDGARLRDRLIPPGEATAFEFSRRLVSGVDRNAANPDHPDRMAGLPAALASIASNATTDGATTAGESRDVASRFDKRLVGRVQARVHADGSASIIGAIAERNSYFVLTSLAPVPADRVSGLLDNLVALFEQLGSAERLPPAAEAGRVLVDVQIRHGIWYAPHPCFALDPERSGDDGPAFRYHPGFADAGTVNRLQRIKHELERERDTATPLGNEQLAALATVVGELAARGVTLPGTDVKAEGFEAALDAALRARGHWLTAGECADRFRIRDFPIVRSVGLKLGAPLAPLAPSANPLPEGLARRLDYHFDAATHSGDIVWHGRMQPADRSDLDALSTDTMWRDVVFSLFNASARVATRELTAADYVLQIRRLADPTTSCPIAQLLGNYIHGFNAYRAALNSDLEAERARRRREQGFAYSQEADERDNPIRLDLAAPDCPGVLLPDPDDPMTFRIVLDQPWPQLRYWLAMPFFAPMPWEAISFFRQAPLAVNDITLTRFPVGTGSMRMENYDRTREIRLVRNECYRRDTFPTIFDEVFDDHSMTQTLLELGPAASREFVDAGRPLPFLDEVVFTMEAEAVPRWHKFLQGYFDRSTIADSVFEGVVQTGTDAVTIKTDMADRRIRMDRDPLASLFYFGFNMRDPLLGGRDVAEALSEPKCKLRQALCIALDIEEWNDIFYNSRYLPAHGPIPPGILGNTTPDQNFNPYVYNRTGMQPPVRKSMEEARRLLAEAGYPGGKDASGQTLTIHFDTNWVGPQYQTRFEWLSRRFDMLGIHLDVRATDYNRFQDKIHTGKHQMVFWGWNADYPDPENFLFLFYGPNHATPTPGDEREGENSSNYENPEFDRLFELMATMPDDTDVADWSGYSAAQRQPVAKPNGVPDREEIIAHAVEILRHDSPWAFGFYTVAMTLSHHWLRNGQNNEMANNVLKYRRVNGAERREYQLKYDRPVWWPLWVLIAVFLMAAVPAAIGVWRRANVAM